MKKKVLHATIDPDLMYGLVELSEEKGTTRSTLVNRALDRFIRDERKGELKDHQEQPGVGKHRAAQAG